MRTPPYYVVDGESAQEAPNADEFYFNKDDEFAGFLIDRRTNTIVFCDRMEPEDATLGRALSPLVALLNKEASNAAR